VHNVPKWAVRPPPQSSPEMHTKAQFRRITNAGWRESHVHDVAITREAPNSRENM